MKIDTIAIIIAITIGVIAIIVAYYTIEKRLIDYRMQREIEIMRMEHELEERHKEYIKAKNELDEVEKDGNEREWKP